MDKLTVNELLRAVELHRVADDCGPGAPSRYEAEQEIIKRIVKHRRAAARLARELLDESRRSYIHLRYPGGKIKMVYTAQEILTWAYGDDDG